MQISAAVSNTQLLFTLQTEVIKHFNEYSIVFIRKGFKLISSRIVCAAAFLCQFCFGMSLFQQEKMKTHSKQNWLSHTASVIL